MIRSSSFVLALALATACGGAPPATPSPTPSAKPVASAAPTVPPLGTDTSAVPEPKSLLVVGRVKDLTKALKSVHAWSQLPMPKDDAVTELLTTEAVGGLVDLEQPVDFAVAVTGSGSKLKEQIAVSAAVKDFEKAKLAFLEHFKLTLDNGTLHVDGLGRAASKEDDDDEEEERAPKGEAKKDDESEDRRHCALAPAYATGSAGAVRLVCGWSLGALHDLGPYLTRTLTRTPPKTDFTMQLRTAPVKQAIAEQKPMLRGLVSSMIGMRGGGRGMSDLVGAIGMDLADLALDLDAAALDATVEDSGAGLALSAKLGGQSAALSKLMTQHPERTDVAPAAFWQLPGDAEIAMFHRGIEKEELDSGRDLFANVIGAQLASDGLTDPERQAILDACKRMLSGAPGVFAAGVDSAKVRRAFAEQRQLDRYSSSFGYGRPAANDEKRFEARRAAAEAILGWTVFGVEDGSAKIAQAARDAVAAFAKPKVQTAYKTKRKDGPWPAMRIGATPKGAPKDTLHVEVDLYPYLPPVAKPTPPVKPTAKPAPAKPTPAKPEEKKEAGPPKPLRLHVLVVPDGASRTWIVVSADEATAVAKATVAVSGADSERLAKLAGIEGLRTAKVGAGGFVTQRGWPLLPQRFAALNSTFGGVGEHYDDMTAAQHGGTTPVVFGFTAQSATQASATVQLPRAAIEDFVVSFIKKLSGG